MSVRKSQDLKREKIAKGQIIQDPNTQPGVAPASNGDSFVPSTEWQDVPDWAVLPNGGQYRTNFQTRVNQARWDEPVPGPETVIDKRKLATPPQGPSLQIPPAPIGKNGAQASSEPNFVMYDRPKNRPTIGQAKKIDHRPGDSGMHRAPAIGTRREAACLSSAFYRCDDISIRCAAAIPAA
jgi:hypothetical protein